MHTRGRFDVIVVWKFDRFARSVSHLLRALETFKSLGIDFVSYSEAMDTSTPAGKTAFTVLGARGIERSLIVERVRAGLRNAKAKGKSLGRPRVFVDAERVAELRASGRRGRRLRESSASAWGPPTAFIKNTRDISRPDSFPQTLLLTPRAAIDSTQVAARGLPLLGLSTNR